MNLLGGYEACFESNLIPGYLEGEEIGNFKQNHFTSDLSLKYVLDLNQQLGLGLLFEYSAVYPNKSMQTLYPDVFNFERIGFAGFGLMASYRLNTLDDLVYPTQGSRVGIYVKGIINPWEDLKYLSDTTRTELSLTSFGKLYMNFENFSLIGRKFSLNSGLSLGLSTDDFIASDYFYVGGHDYNIRRNQIPFIGYRVGEVVATNFLDFKLGLNYRLYRNIQLEILSNMLIGSDNFNDLASSIINPNMNDLHIGYGGGLTYKTPLGPIKVFLAGNNQDARLRFYFNIGFTF
jgi:outer membrane translocation and assembly module TamA